MSAKLPSLDLAYESVQKLLDLQFQQVDGLDTKANFVLAAAGIIIAALLGSFSREQVTQPLVLALGVAFVSVSALMSLLALWIRDFERPPHVGRLRDYYIVRDLEETKLMVVDVSLGAIVRNHGRILKKIRQLTVAFLFLFLGGLTLGSYFITLLVTGP